jgi:hypothetical protein
MKKRRRTKLIHEGKYIAEVDVELMERMTNGHCICLWRTLQA